MSGIEIMHDSVVGMGMCRPRVSASRSGGEATATSQLINNAIILFALWKP